MTGSYDAALHLLDRQVVDSDGRLVCKVDDVELTVGADGSLVPTALLVGLPVAADTGTGLHRRSRVLDVRVVPVPDGRRTVVDALVVGPGRPGALLGYDRRSEPGPWLVADLVRWLHRHARVVALGPGVEIDVPRGEVRISERASVAPLLG